MLYQKMLMGSKPYFILAGEVAPFEIHRHHEIELTYCTEGVFDIICENKRYSLATGDLLVMSPMISHEIPQNIGFSQKLTINVGYSLLGEYFETFASQNISCHFYKKVDLQHDALYQKLELLLKETVSLYYMDSFYDQLSIKGNLYKICALLLQMSGNCIPNNTQKKKLTDIKKIDQALEKIYNYYYEPLSIEEMSEFCGYSKSNFCQIFKNITGDTFHNTLNRHRIEMSCMLLRETNYTIEKISQETGFIDIKSFGRVFKRIMGQNAREYRKQFKAE